MGGFISPCCKWWQTLLEIDIWCSQWEGSMCTSFSFFFFRVFQGLGNGLFFGFSCLLQMCSHQVPKGFPIRFPNGFPSVLQPIPNCTSISYHIIKFSLGFSTRPKFPMRSQHILNSISIHFLAGFPLFDQDVTFLCHGLYTPVKAHGLGFTKINLEHTLGYQLGVHFDNLKGWVWCILLFLMAENKRMHNQCTPWDKRMAGWRCLSLTSKLDLIWNLAAERHSRYIRCVAQEACEKDYVLERWAFF